MKLILPIGLGIFLVWYSYNTTTPENRIQIARYIKEADPFWVGLSIVIGILSHVSRAIRWNYLLEPLGYRPKIRNNIFKELQEKHGDICQLKTHSDCTNNGAVVDHFIPLSSNKRNNRILKSKIHFLFFFGKLHGEFLIELKHIISLLF